MQQFNLAIGALQRGEFNDAERIFRGIVAGDAQNFDALHMLGVVCSETGKIPDAEKFFQAALAIDSKYPPCFRNYGLLLAKQKKFNEAIRQFDKAIALAGNFAPAYSDRGICLQELDRLDESIASFNTAAKLAPDVPVVFNNRGNSFFKKGNYDLAIQDYKKAIALNPNYAEAYCGLGNVFAALKRYGEAIEASDKALSINSSLAEIWLGRGKICQIIKRYNDALESFDRALALNLRLEEAWLGRGNCFNDLKHCTEALDAYDKALALNPNLAEAWLGRGVSFGTLKRYTEALGAYDKALALNPNLAGAEGARLNIKMLLCDWKNFDAECEHLISSGRSGTANAEPFVILTISSSAADQIQFTQHYVAEAIPEFPQVWQGERYVHDRIRIAYLSSDYRVHPIAHLISEMLELHDRGKFEIIGISHGPDDESATRARLVKSFDQFHDVQKLGDDAAAALIKRLEIDIAVDLNGYTSLARPGILARRPAPVQAMYLGYAGTMGAKFIDYAIVDKIVLPEELQKYWTEKPAYLPDTFMAQDRVARRNMPAEPLTRAQAGLPENAFVFCCFNNTHKLNPSIFQVWMRLLKAVAGSVVWMSVCVPKTKPGHSGDEARQGLGVKL